MSIWDHNETRALIDLALHEDIGEGDITTNTCIPAERPARGRYFARQDMVLAGVELLPVLFERFSVLFGLPAETPVLLHASGDRVADGTMIAEVQGPARTLLTCERTSLNLLQRLSGVATLARQYADAVSGTKCQVLDTRKTTPGLRRLEKLAAVAGGVTNHRSGLYDAVLIKNNHITAAGGVREALGRFTDATVPVEIEVRTREELAEALDAGAKHLLLDNLTPAEARVWIAEIAGRATSELSGNINLDTVRAYAETGADFVSSGAITHQARSVDLNFRVELG